VTPEAAGALLAQLKPTLDMCRRVLTEAQHTRSWTKVASDGRRETVSDLDLAVEEKVIAAVHAIDPSASVYSEETRHDSTALDDELCVVLDPIDGTDLLLTGQSGFSISIAILSQHRVIAGLLDFPARGQRFVCTLGGGTELNGRRLQLGGGRELAEARISVSSTQLGLPSLQRFWTSLGVAALVPTPGFTAKLGTMLVEECDAALYLPVDPRPTYIWDYAAAALLLAEAGGTLTTLEGTRFLDALPIQQSEGWLAAAGDLHPSLQRTVTAALRTHLERGEDGAP
jgi:myo-inositol-1(or 4)-monophosphatase